MSDNKGTKKKRVAGAAKARRGGGETSTNRLGFELLRLLPGYSGRLLCLAWSPDGLILAAGSSRGTVGLWDTGSGVLLRMLSGHAGPVMSLAWSREGRILASGSSDKTLRVWDPGSGKLLQTLTGNQGWVRCAAWSSDGRILASGSDDKSIRLWDAESGSLLKTLLGHGGPVMSLAWSTEGRTLASGSSDKSVRFWDSESGKATLVLDGHAGPVRSVAWSPDGRTVASGSDDRTISLQDAQSGKLLRSLAGHDYGVRSVVWSPDGRRIASGSDDESIRCWDPESGQLLQTLVGHARWVAGVAWSPDGAILASCSFDGTTRLWDPQSGRFLRTLPGHTEAVASVALSPDGRAIASASRDKTVQVWNAESGELRWTLPHSSYPDCAAWSPDGRLIAAGSWDGRVALWESQSGNHLRTLKGDSRAVFPPPSPFGPALLSLAWSPDGHTIAAGSRDRTIHLWDADSGEMRRTFEGHFGPVEDVAWSPDGRAIASASLDKTVGVWDAASGVLQHTLRHTGAVLCAAWSPDGRFIASGSEDKTIHIWNADSGELLETLEGHTESVRSLAWSADGRLLASGADDGVRLWAAEPWQVLLTIQGHNCVAFPAQGQTLVTWSVWGDIAIWRPGAGQLQEEPRAETVRYASAKVMLVGETGVGKTGLLLVLLGEPFAATISTHGRNVRVLERIEVDGETRETFLWDLGGQPGYRLVQQLHMRDAAAALVIVDARSETDPLGGVRYWARALRLAERLRGGKAIEKLLVVAREDRGGLPVGKERMETVVRELGFAGTYRTSAKEGWGIPELSAAIRRSVSWKSVPRVHSDRLFKDIKDFLVARKETGQVLSTLEELYFSLRGSGLAPAEAGSASQAPSPEFRTCLDHLELQGLVQKLSFGGLVLLQPEMLDSYASALVNAARQEPDGLGAIPEVRARSGDFPIPQEARLRDREQERLLLSAAIEDLLLHEVALREDADLVFPSQLTKENPELPDLPGKAVVFRFEGPVLNIYATLAVRLTRSGIFSVGAMWKNAISFSTAAGESCVMALRELSDEKGELTLFYVKAGDGTRGNFEGFIDLHLRRKALAVERRRIVVCPRCSTPVSELAVERRHAKGHSSISCNVCDYPSIPIETQEPRVAAAEAAVDEMNQAADEGGRLEAGIASAAAVLRGDEFARWVGAPRAILAVVFTDIVGSTRIGEKLGDEAMGELRRAHYARARQEAADQRGFPIKTIGDSFMVAFNTVETALDFAVKLHDDTGSQKLKIRSGIHVGPVDIEEGDAFGGTVNYAARVVAQASSGLWISADAKKHLDLARVKRHERLKWSLHPNLPLKGFKDKQTLWSTNPGGRGAKGGSRDIGEDRVGN